MRLFFIAAWFILNPFLSITFRSLLLPDLFLGCLSPNASMSAGR
ncbi:hypothetical protein GDO81_005919 [Engystomops pustulosus]|uniref:Uncharacterized protein n=1 Tax=Engystomops pustulosus TaxID=76066 RepID=A0AAV7CUR4_ENGPU|nr:hypothetical protein GDO81_005919 [Engystomops pustulosus]